MSDLSLISQSTLNTSQGELKIHRLDTIEKEGLGSIQRLPYTIRILLEGALRNSSRKEVSTEALKNLADWQPHFEDIVSVPFFPGRVVMQDFSGVPVIVDLAAMRSAMQRLGGDPGEIKPSVPVDIVIDHSIQVDYFGSDDAMQRNTALEFERNRERYEFLHWAQKAFDNLRVIPPSTGIIHQVNLEYLTRLVLLRQVEGDWQAYPDTLVGTDSHTTMINGLGVVGWGVGGIEAVAAMLGQPIEILMPEVIGVRLSGQLPEGTTPTDLTLTITEILRKKGVVGKFVEFFGSGLSSLTLADRAMIANMSPENGATVTYFPIDDQTLNYLKLTGRPQDLIELVEKYTKEQHLFHLAEDPVPEFSDILEINLADIEPSLAGPKRPQDRVPLSKMKSVFEKSLELPKKERGFGLDREDTGKKVTFKSNGTSETMEHGSVVIAAITSCTNTSNPYVMVAAGLLAKKALEKGLKVKPYIKTSLAPGSRVVTEYLQSANLLDPLGKLGFNLVGYGCTTCIGNTGPLPDEIANTIQENNLVAAAVLSGNRNFEGRISPHTQANYLASPPLVVAYALAGTVDIDLYNDPIGTDSHDKPVYLQDIWPSSNEVFDTINEHIDSEMFRNNYAEVFRGNEVWNQLQSKESLMYPWDPRSTYLQEPPFFEGMSHHPEKVKDIRDARVLALLGDSITTDHISPAGAIPLDGPAGRYLVEQGVAVKDFNSFGSRRGNDRVMVRGTFGNIRLKNQLVPGVEGGYTLHLPDKEKMSIYDAALQYREEGIPLIILAGKEYGTGSSRDWAAKGAMLLGVKAVIAESYERIHRSNLVGMGILPLQFMPGENADTIGLNGHERYSITGIEEIDKPHDSLTVTAVAESGRETTFHVIARLDTMIEVDYYKKGGILQTILYDQLS